MPAAPMEPALPVCPEEHTVHPLHSLLPEEGQWSREMGVKAKAPTQTGRSLDRDLPFLSLRSGRAP